MTAPPLVNDLSSSSQQPSDAQEEPEFRAATVIQSAYRGFRTRQELQYGHTNLASKKWRGLIDYSRQMYIHRIDASRATSLTSNTSPHKQKVRWAWRRAEFLASRLAKGSSCVSEMDETLMLTNEHWLELTDIKHRYGSNLQCYFNYWLQQDTKQPFHYWLDKGEGKDVDLEERPRALLEEQQVQYLKEDERKGYAVYVVNGLLYYKESGELVHTIPPSMQVNEEVDVTKLLPETNADDDEETKREKKRVRGKNKYIYVTDPEGTLYVHRKVKGRFHHSSFLGGGAVCSAGAIIVNQGILLKLNPKSGHYRPRQKHFDRLQEWLRESSVDMKNVKVSYGILEDGTVNE
ncbi:hypothetical protein BGZ65_003361 [Modicella reniformis]|uniref:Uncharacterized protein n=1 Tax=Modicella reniformis TaxID=1440133 RepID=A0A9P6J099_9FUNG|nr:hypothetical protein BGZ65_003361 [Modicella reniformis]